MLQLSKILHSRDNWKRTTIESRYEIREFKKNQTAPPEKNSRA